MPKGALLILSLCLFHAVTAKGQQDSGFINIDCGKDANSMDPFTGLTYVTDSGYIDTGVNQKPSSAILAGSTYYPHANDLRSFPNGTRNCYTIPVVSGNKYLVKDWFMYGNYDGLNRKPMFDIHIDTNYWTTVIISNASSDYYYEIMVVAKSSRMSMCLVDTGNGEPFISAIELRPLPSDAYPQVNFSQALINVARYDFGAKKNTLVRYNKDVYDRMWVGYTQSDWTVLETSSDVAVTNVFFPPAYIMQTAVTPSSGSSLEFEIPIYRITSPPPLYHFFIHFAEVQILKANQSRIFNITLNDRIFYSNFSPSNLSLNTIFSKNPTTRDQIKFSLEETGDSNLPPIVNAVESYIVAATTGQQTNVDDADAMMDIRKFYELVQQNWMGDPCNPSNLTWTGVGCTNDSDTTEPSRIISLKLAHFGLSGNISSAFRNLSELQYLDLSENNLTGSIPDFLGNLEALTFLNLTGNNLSGPIPNSIQSRVSSGALKFSFITIQNITENHSSKKKKNTTKIIVAVVASVCFFAILTVLGLFARKRCQRRKDFGNPEQQDAQIAIQSGPFRVASFRQESKQFTYQQLISITNNFSEKIGEGGFGMVFRGQQQNGKEVAVKMLSKSSHQGEKEFKMEARLLTSIYHKNLVPLLGYCNDNDHMSLVYEYMANGSIADHLSGKIIVANTQMWRERLRIGVDAAQGLDYLHNGCKPSIVHRDVKTSNILLNHEFEAKIADFGLSKILKDDKGSDFISTAVMGTPGYLDPEYSNTGKLNEKSDVYSFGIVMLELITGRPPILKAPDFRHIVSWVEALLETGDLNQIVDPRLNGDYNPHSVWKTLEAALACVAPTSIQRPTMNEALSLLKDCYKLEMSSEGIGSTYSNGSIVTLSGINTAYYSSSGSRTPLSGNYDSRTIPEPR